MHFTPRNNSAEHAVLTVDSVTGPSGARPTRILPGKYVVRGRYDLTRKNFRWGLIRLYVIGNTMPRLPEGFKEMSEEDQRRATSPHHQIKNGDPPEGEFTLTFTLDKVGDKGGPLTLHFFHEQTFRHHSVTHETLELE